MSEGNHDNNNGRSTLWVWSSPVVRLVVAGLVLAALLGVGRIRLPVYAVDVSPSGTFAEEGSIPSGAAAPHGLSWWSSWSGSDDYRGALAMGPFPAPARLGFFAAGYPRIGGNRLYLENATTGEIIDPGWENFAESWSKAMVAVPSSWLGEPIYIHAIDDAAEWGGWLALSPPFRVPWIASWWNGPPSRLCAFLFVGVHLGILVLGASGLARRFVRQFDALVLLVALAILATAGYLVFWLALIHPGLGVLASWVLLAAAMASGLRSPGCVIGPRGAARMEWLIPLALTLGAGVFYVATWHEFSIDSPMSYLAQHRFSPGLPADNVIPQIFAGRLSEGLSPRQLMGDWLSSDRPPLQTGWVLVFWPVARLTGLDFDTVAQCAGLWFQLHWVPSLWLLLRSLRVPTRTVAVIIVALVPAGFFLLNSVYVWPKLGGGAFMVGAFTCWFLVPDHHVARRLRFGIGGALAALAWLSHGSAAFSLLALIPIALLCWRQTGWRAWRRAALVFLVGAVPWIAYQKLYEPPGNRLLKWHIAGVVPLDDRSFGAALVDSYREQTWNDWLIGRKANLNTIVAGPWSELTSLGFGAPQAWRDAQGFAFFSFGWWNLGFVALPLALWLPALRASRASFQVAGLTTLVAWAFLTFLVWVGLMFIGGSTLVHQGSYAPMIALFAALALALWRLHLLAFLAVTVLQLVMFVGVWASKPAHWAGAAWNKDAVALMVLSYACLAAVVVWARQRDLDAS